MPDWSASTGPWLPPNGASWRSRRSLDGSRTWRASCAPPGGSTPRAPEENVDDRVLSPALRHRGRAERGGRRGPPNGLEALNESKWPGHPQWRPLAVFARDGESIVAGLAGETYSGWLFIRYLWVSEARRGQGIGRKLMGGAEARALERGCHSAWVDTFSFQAPGFYPKLGYTIFGELDYPPGHKRFFLQKRLSGEAQRTSSGLSP